MTTPATPGLGPDPADPGRPLVEAWALVSPGGAVRMMGRKYECEAAQKNWAAPDRRDGFVGTVVPLIAADRLTDEALVQAVSNLLHPGRPERYEIETRGTLAALRAHLESQ